MNGTHRIREGLAGHMRFRRIAILLLTALLVLTTGAWAESDSEPNGIDLYLPSDPEVGNWEYTVENEDLIDVQWEFFPDIHELGLIGTDGADWFHVEGLEPGTTTVRFLYVNSFTQLTDLTLVYRLTVDDELNVMVWGFEMVEPERTPRGEVKSLFFTEGGYGDGRSFSLRRDEEDELLMELDFDGEQAADESLLAELDGILEKYGVVSWNGFNDVGEGEADGNDFMLAIVWENDFSIQATGNNAYPEHFGEFCGAMEDLFDAAE